MSKRNHQLESHTVVADVSVTGRRNANQDRTVARKWENNPPRSIIAIADGVGGGILGGEAAQIAIDTLTGAVENAGHPAWNKDDSVAEEALRLIAANAHKDIIDLAKKEGGGNLSATTFTAVLVQGDLARIVHIGDTRAYLVYAGHEEQITTDHRPDPSVRAPSNVITRCLGCSKNEVETKTLTIPTQSVVLVASDGLYGPLKPQDIIDRLERRPSLQESITDLSTLAYNLGSEDNISIAAIEVGEFPRTQPFAKPLARGEIEKQLPPESSTGLPILLKICPALAALFSIFLFIVSLAIVSPATTVAPNSTLILDVLIMLVSGIFTASVGIIGMTLASRRRRFTRAGFAFVISTAALAGVFFSGAIVRIIAGG